MRRTNGSSSLLVTADDLTGASDVATAFAEAGVRVRILVGAWRRTREQAPTSTGEVQVLDLDCRDANPATVRRRVCRAVRAAAAHGPEHWYHKIDSALRGSVSYQIRALMHALAVRLAVLVPANPKNGRTTKNGIHYVNGTPVARSSISNGPSLRHKSSRVMDILGELRGVRTRIVDLSEIGRGHGHVSGVLQGLRDRPSVAIMDATTDRHLRTIAAAVRGFRLVIGSAGLARHLAWFWMPRAHAGPRVTHPRRIGSATLIVAGSCAPETRRQNEAVRKWLGDSVRLLVPQESVDVHKGLRLAMKMNLPDVGRVIVCGGRTASEVCRVLGVRELDLLRPIHPGIGISLARGERELLMVLKPGSFGPPGFYRKAIRAMDNLLRGSASQ